MPTTSNFGWTTPADTDLVKDGAAAIRTLGNGIDTSLVDLKGGTTGQILSKNSNTDLDYVWINNDQGDITAVTAGTGISGGGTTGAVTITNSMATTIDAKGDLIVGTGADAFARLPVGTNGHTLVADSAETTGLKWAAPSSGSLTSLATGSLSTNSVTISGISSSYTHLQLFLYDFFPNNNADLYLQFNGDTGSNYGYCSMQNIENVVSFSGVGATEIRVCRTVQNQTRDNAAVFNIYNYADTNAFKCFTWNFNSYRGNNNRYETGQGAGGYNSTSAISSIRIYNESTHTFSGGSYILYGVK